MDGKVIATVHDNARNVTASVKDSHRLGESVPCFAHTLQLAVNSALEHAKCIIQRATKIVSHFRHSALETSALLKNKKNSNFQNIS